MLGSNVVFYHLPLIEKTPFSLWPFAHMRTHTQALGVGRLLTDTHTCTHSTARWHLELSSPHLYVGNSYILDLCINFHVWFSTEHISVSDSVYTYSQKFIQISIYTQVSGGREKQTNSHFPYCFTHLSLPLNVNTAQFLFWADNYIFWVKKETAPFRPELTSSSVTSTELPKHHTLLPPCDALCTLEESTINCKSL